MLWVSGGLTILPSNLKVFRFGAFALLPPANFLALGLPLLSCHRETKFACLLVFWEPNWE